MSSISDQILGAWDEAEDEEAPTESTPGDAEPVATTTDETEAEDEASPGEETPEEEEIPFQEEEVPAEPGEEVEEEEPSEAEEVEEPSEEEEESTPPVSDDPEVQAFVARHGGVEGALKKAVNLQRVLDRQGRELGGLRTRNEELEAQLEQVALFSQSGRLLDAEQQQWVEEAVSSENPLSYIQLAVNEGEYDLARAVLDQGEFPTAQVLRLAQGIDAAEARSNQVVQPTLPLDHQTLMGVLVEHYPEMPQFEAEMVATLQALGEDHPLAALARSQDPGEAAQGIIGIYEIARAKTATVASTREAVKTKSRQAAEDARRGAVVSSSQSAPTQVQTPRPKQIMPGLTLEALNAEFASE